MFQVIRLLFSVLVANVLFFGMGDGSIGNTISIAIVSSLVVTPVSILFPLLFIKSSLVTAHAERKAVFMPAIKARQFIAESAQSAQRILSFSWFLLVVWVAGCVLLCLVYGMQVFFMSFFNY